MPHFFQKTTINMVFFDTLGWHGHLSFLSLHLAVCHFVNRSYWRHQLSSPMTVLYSNWGLLLIHSTKVKAALARSCFCPSLHLARNFFFILSLLMSNSSDNIYSVILWLFANNPSIYLAFLSLLLLKGYSFIALFCNQRLFWKYLYHSLITVLLRFSFPYAFFLVFDIFQ